MSYLLHTQTLIGAARAENYVKSVTSSQHPLLERSLRRIFSSTRARQRRRTEEAEMGSGRAADPGRGRSGVGVSVKPTL